jgi:putative DNA primase/helicase
MPMPYDVALEYIQKGLHVIPIQSGGKRPILQDWVNEATNDHDTVTSWFKGKDLNIGIVTGKKSGIIVIDIDTKHNDGRKSIAEQEAKLDCYLPPTVTAKTQGGGLHLFYKYPADVDKVTGRIGILESVDIRADGNQVVVFPSRGEHGEYTWVTSPMDTSMASLPRAWKNFICGIDEPDTVKIPKRAFRLPVKIPSGMRHATLLSYACSLGAKGHNPTEISGAVREANRTVCAPPIEDETEIENIIAWAIEKTSEPQIQRVPEGLPPWIAVNSNGKQSVDEPSFVGWYKNEHSLLCINGIFYDEDGVVDVAMIRRDIQALIAEYVETSLSAKVNALVEALKNECYFEPPAPRHDIVNLLNTSLRIDETGIYEVDMGFTLNRLNVRYTPSVETPLWEEFLHTLLEEEDILTLQEYIGYCLVPTTIAQKALFMIGKGGEGKSVVGEVVQSLFGSSMIQGELHRIQDNRFMLAQLENKLVFYDDDLQSSALDDTGTFKKLVTATIPVLVERKGEPHYEMLPYARILASGNKGIEACYDHSDGFYRRLILLKCKTKPVGRKDDKLLAKRIIKHELAGILNWALVGLQRLMAQEWEFTLSSHTVQALQQAEEDSNSFLAFLRDRTTVEIGEGFTITSGDLYYAYERWCDDNAVKPVAMRTVTTWMRENGDVYGFSYIPNLEGKRGYEGLQTVKEIERVGRFKIVKGGL